MLCGRVGRQTGGSAGGAVLDTRSGSPAVPGEARPGGDLCDFGLAWGTTGGTGGGHGQGGAAGVGLTVRERSLSAWHGIHGIGGDVKAQQCTAMHGSETSTEPCAACCAEMPPSHQKPGFLKTPQSNCESCIHARTGTPCQEADLPTPAGWPFGALGPLVSLHADHRTLAPASNQAIKA